MKRDAISNKTKKAIVFIFYIFLFIAVRIWHLTVIEKDEKIKEATRPRTKSILKKTKRGSILDRYGAALAQNRIKYSACIYYAEIRELPTYIWEKRKKKRYVRKEYIRKLSEFLSSELDLEADRIEDLVHSKASLIPHVPFVIKDDIKEKTYYRLRAREKDFPGLHAEIDHARFYPFKKVACDLLGYMGSISEREYFKIASEIKTLEKIVSANKNSAPIPLPKRYKNFEQVEKRLNYLKEKAYRVNDFVGKSGIEREYDALLRGFHGKSDFFVNVKGSFLKEIERKDPIPGKTITSTISKELQEFSEKLLIEFEKIRDGKSLKYDPEKKVMVEKKEPFIKGGAIIAMDPNSGEILSFASYPRFDPNDFISPKSPKKILNWLELSKNIENIWNGKTHLEREVLKKDREVKKFTLKFFLESVLQKDSPIIKALEKIKNIKNAISIQESVETLLYLTKKDPVKLFDELFSKEDYFLKKDIRALKKRIYPYLKDIEHPYDKTLLIDICRILVPSFLFSDNLIERVGDLSLKDYWEISKNYLSFEDLLKKDLLEPFKKTLFKIWREKNLKDFLKEKRSLEKRKKSYAKPYIDYLDQIEKKLFLDFFQKIKIPLITSLIKDQPPADKKLNLYFETIKNLKENENFLFLKDRIKNLSFEESFALLKTIRTFSSLGRKLLIGSKRLKLEKDLAASFYPKNGFGFGTSFCFRKEAPLGSIFKLVTSYAALKTKYDSLAKSGIFPKVINPLTITDITKWDSSASKKGSMVVGYSEKNIPYPKHYKGGRLISSARKNIGKVDIISAIAQSSNPYFSILAGDILKDPSDLSKAAQLLGIGRKTGINLPFEFSGNLPTDLKNKTSLYSFAIGQHTLVVTPLQAAVLLSAIANGGYILQPTVIIDQKRVIRKVDLPHSIRNTLLEGMEKAIFSKEGTASPHLINYLKGRPNVMERYKSLKNQFVGKTSTAEIMYKMDISKSGKAEKYKHIWFGAISFLPSKKKWEKPELVVVVFLRFGDSGKEAAPIASEIIHKYRSIKKKYIKNS